MGVVAKEGGSATPLLLFFFQFFLFFIFIFLFFYFLYSATCQPQWLTRG
jgi:hypothetical protein